MSPRPNELFKSICIEVPIRLFEKRIRLFNRPAATQSKPRLAMPSPTRGSFGLSAFCVIESARWRDSSVVEIAPY
ncbi:MAG: hypothetical protein ABSG41_06795 [Bryobacteraceae bacterium]|jgi:hypothetical protein